MIGVPGASFAAADIIAPIYGILLGPIIGPLSIVLGTFLAIVLGRPATFLGLDFLPATVNALLVGLLMRGRWIVSVATYAALLSLFLIHPLSAVFIPAAIPWLNISFQLPFHWMHFIALIVLVSPLSRRSVGWVTGPPITRLALGVTVLSFIGTFAQHSTGSVLWETVYGMVLKVIKPDAFFAIWNAVFWIYPLERVFLVIAATIIGTASVRALKAAGLVFS